MQIDPTDYTVVTGIDEDDEDMRTNKRWPDRPVDNFLRTRVSTAKTVENIGLRLNYKQKTVDKSKICVDDFCKEVAGKLRIIQNLSKITGYGLYPVEKEL